MPSTTTYDDPDDVRAAIVALDELVFDYGAEFAINDSDRTVEQYHRAVAHAAQHYLDVFRAVYERAEHDCDSTPNGWTDEQRDLHDRLHAVLDQFVNDGRFRRSAVLDAFHNLHGCDRPSG